MNPDWKALAPHRPLSAEDLAYAPPPDPAGERVAKWLLAGGSNTVLLGGPVGSGKSTELARCGALLKAKGGVVCSVALDRLFNMKKITPDEARVAVGRALIAAARDSGVSTSTALADAVVSEVPREAAHFPFGPTILSPQEFLQQVTEELARKFGSDQTVTLLIDGLEKSPDDIGLAVLETLADVPDTMNVAVVAPWYAIFGPDRTEVIRPGERREYVRVPTTDIGTTGARFLVRLMLLRLGVAAPTASLRTGLVELMGNDSDDDAETMATVCQQAASLSGGLPRTFLQLLSTAATYARVRRDAFWPNMNDLNSAIIDQVEEIRRSFLRGDREALTHAHRTHGGHLELSQRIRLMAEGFLLERTTADGFILEMHPLVERALKVPAHA